MFFHGFPSPRGTVAAVAGRYDATALWGAAGPAGGATEGGHGARRGRGGRRGFGANDR